MGRKTRLTPEIQAQIVNALNSGNWQEVACEYAGIHVATYYRWLERGQEEISRLETVEEAEPLEEETPYREFCEAVRKAQAVAEVQAVGLIRKAAVEGSWQAAGWYLERSHAKRWSKVDKLEHTGKEGTPIQLNVSVADLEKEIESLLEGSRGTTRDDTDSNA
jgi:hypothetical protein